MSRPKDDGPGFDQVGEYIGPRLGDDCPCGTGLEFRPLGRGNGAMLIGRCVATLVACRKCGGTGTLIRDIDRVPSRFDPFVDDEELNFDW